MSEAEITNQSIVILWKNLNDLQAMIYIIEAKQ